MKSKLLIFILVFITLAAVVLYLRKDYPLPRPDVTTPKSLPSSADSTNAVENIATGLNIPWALAFLPNGSIVITQRNGKVMLLDKNGILEIGKIDVSQKGESGLHGVAIHPDFNKNHFVYFYHSYASSGQESQNKVVRFSLKENKLEAPTTIVDKIPGAIFHDGGRIKFGPDKNLYITTGDALNPSFAQNKNSLAGKILRVTDEGRVVAGNPFNNLVYSYGHRNPQGIAWDDMGRLFETEHGNSATDEVNIIEPGKNYGWPDIRGEQKRNGITSPIIQSGSVTWAPAGTAFYKGSLFFGGLRGQTLFELNTNTLVLKEHFKKEFGRIREVVLGPDNMLYITTSNNDGRGDPKTDDDKIIRVDPRQLN